MRIRVFILQSSCCDGENGPCQTSISKFSPCLRVFNLARSGLEWVVQTHLAGRPSHVENTPLSDWFPDNKFLSWICQPPSWASQMFWSNRGGSPKLCAQAPSPCEGKRGGWKRPQLWNQSILSAFTDELPSGWICWDLSAPLITEGIGGNETAKVLRLILAFSPEFQALRTVENKLS